MLAGETAVNWLWGHPAAIGLMCHSRTFYAKTPHAPAIEAERRALPPT